MAAIDVWLKHTAYAESLGPERVMMLELRERLAVIPQEANGPQLEAAIAAINTVVAFALKRGVVRFSDKTKR